jgi:hypothetical protein
MTTTTTTIPLPHGAVGADDWAINGDTVSRYFFGTKRGNRFRVGIMGEQDHGGAVLSRTAYVTTEPHELDLGLDLDADELREIAADCLAAADELDTL